MPIGTQIVRRGVPGGARLNRPIDQAQTRVRRTVRASGVFTSHLAGSSHSKLPRALPAGRPPDAPGVFHNAAAPCLRYCLILFAGASADADRTHDLPFAPEWYSAGENHDPSGIGDMDSRELAAGLGVLRQILGGHVESPRCVRFVNRNIDAADLGAVHPHA
jgi:hypothetical protein